ncbi:MAG: response regulator transcription factor [Anaerolineae bacterium]|nr:response regulator transcription factor [Anaerolineae bacterium]
MTDIFIISEYLMFGHGLESLLLDEKELNVVGHEKNFDLALEKIRELQPDVVVVFGNASEKAYLSIMNILETKPNTQIIGVSVQDNTCYTYRATRWNALNVSDLVSVIKGDSPVEFEYSH